MNIMSKNINGAAAERAGQEASHMSATADRVVASMNKVDKKVADLTRQCTSDPETASDKIIGMATPALSGMIAGKVFQLIWDAVTAKIHPSPKDDAEDKQRGIVASMIFAAFSAAFTTLITTIATRGTNKFIAHRIIKREKK